MDRVGGAVRSGGVVTVASQASYAVHSSEAILVLCRRCGAHPGDRCRTPKGRATFPHTERFETVVEIRVIAGYQPRTPAE